MIAPVIHILIDEEGIARTINRRVKVKMIVQKHLTGGETPPAIADHYGIDLADVHGALAYYYDNKAALDAEIARDEALIQQVGVSGADLKAKIRQRMTSQGDTA
ncbi:MAG: DUF433 domain-containing protein [Anaerolineae bacterium]|nr:DUF433 domain-containing protein [Anaerolineae bacterium]NUQ07334.1 DUF433 domain-containing protein [Anaerolineae bacterium]